MQVPEEHGVLILVGFEWATFRKRIVLPFAETFSTFPPGRAHQLLEAIGGVNAWDDLKEPMPNGPKISHFTISLSLSRSGPMQEIFLRYVTQSLHAVVHVLSLVNHSGNIIPHILGGLCDKTGVRRGHCDPCV